MNQIVKSNKTTLLSTLTQNQYVYKFGESLMDKYTDTCPVEVFGNGPFMNSCPNVIKELEQSIEKLNAKLQLLDKDNIDAFIEEHFDDVYNREKEFLESELKRYEQVYEETKSKYGEENFTEYFEGFDEEMNELRNKLSKLDIDIVDRLKDEYHESNNVYPEDESHIQALIIELVHEKQEAIFKLEEFKSYKLKQEQEDERKRLMEYLSLPHKRDDVIRNISNFINESVETNYILNLDEFYNQFEQLFPKVKDEKLKKTLRDIFDKGWSKNLKKIHQEHNQTIISKLNYITVVAVEHAQLDETNFGASLELLERNLKSSFKRFIDNQFMTIFNGVYEYLCRIKKSTQSFTNATALRTYAREVMSTISETLITALPVLLNKRFNDFLLDLMEEWGVEPDDNEVKNAIPAKGIIVNRVKVAVKDEVQLCSFTSFLDTIPNEEIDVKELTKLYNDFFNKSISTISFGKLKDVKNHFTKREVKRCGKFIKLYQKV